MQFEVAEDRMINEFTAPCELERLNFSIARRTVPEAVPTLARERNVEVLSRSDGELLALFSDRWRLQGVERQHPDLVLEPLVVS
jgi:peptide chain release factor 3